MRLRKKEPRCVHKESDLKGCLRKKGEELSARDLVDGHQEAEKVVDEGRVDVARVADDKGKI
ncbi:MAG: hypothetical protein ACYTFW_10945 [Planctomycetota bacterium]